MQKRFILTILLIFLISIFNIFNTNVYATNNTALIKPPDLGGTIPAGTPAIPIQGNNNNSTGNSNAVNNNNNNASTTTNTNNNSTKPDTNLPGNILAKPNTLDTKKDIQPEKTTPIVTSKSNETIPRTGENDTLLIVTALVAIVGLGLYAKFKFYDRKVL